MDQILKKAKGSLGKNRHKKNVDSGSTFKTFEDSQPTVKNSTKVINIFKIQTNGPNN